MSGFNSLAKFALSHHNFMNQAIAWWRPNQNPIDHRIEFKVTPNKQEQVAGACKVASPLSF